MAMSTDLKTIATGTKNGCVWRWAVATGKPIGDRLRHHGPVRTLAFCDDGAKIASGSEDHTVQLWNTATAQGKVLEHPKAVRTLAISPNGKTLLSGCDDGVARLWDLATGKDVEDLPRGAAPVTAVGFVRESNDMVALYIDRTVRLFPCPLSDPRPTPMRSCFGRK